MPGYAARAATIPLCALLALALAACTSSSPQPAKPAGSTASPTSTPEPKPVVIGLDLPLSGSAATSGEAIRRGVLFAVEELNGQGGIKGRPLEMVTRDNESNPARGAANVRELVEREGAVAVFGGPHTAVALAELDAIHQLKVPFIVPWATGTRIVQNGQQPNYVFRVSASDTGLARFMAGYLARRLARQSPALLVENTPAGEASAESLTQALIEVGLRPALVEKIRPVEADLAAAVSRIADAGADSVLLLVDAPEATQVLAALGRAGADRPVVTTAAFGPSQPGQAGSPEGASAVYSAQTHSFLGDQPTPAKRVIFAYQTRFGVSGPQGITAPVGVANGFDAMHVLARALRQVDDPRNGDAVRQALENLETPYEGVIKTYQRPFSADSHEALAPEDYVMVVWRDGQATVERAAAR